jgi:hypothetical protein
MQTSATIYNRSEDALNHHRHLSSILIIAIVIVPRHRISITIGRRKTIPRSYPRSTHLAFG